MATYTTPTTIGSVQQHTDGTKTNTIALPSGLAAGDLMVLTVNAVSSAGTITVSGWTQIAGGTATGTREPWVFTRTFVAGDTSAVVVMATGTGGAAVVTITGHRNVASVIVGAGTARTGVASNPNQITSTAASITTTIANTLLLAILTEATTATEAGAPTLSAGSLVIFAPQTTTTTIETVTVASLNQATAGASPTITGTYANPQASNGWGVMLGLVPNPDPVTSLAGKWWDGSTLVPVYYKWWDGTNLLELASMPIVWAGKRVPDFIAKMNAAQAAINSGATGINVNPVLMAHRCGSIGFGEHTLMTSTQSMIGHVDALEISLNITSDGVIFGCHDATLNRTSPSVAAGYTPSAHTWAEIQAINQTVDYAGNTVPGQPYYSLDQLVAYAGLTHTLILDPKTLTTAQVTALIAKIQTYPDWQNTFMGKGFHTSTGTASAFHSIGLKALGYGYQTDVDGTNSPQFSTTQSNWDYIGMDYTANPAAWSTVQGFGKPLWAHIVPNKAAADTGTGVNCKAAILMISGVAATTQVAAGY